MSQSFTTNVSQNVQSFESSFSGSVQSFVTNLTYGIIYVSGSSYSGGGSGTGASVWGQIGGTLSDQTDLVTEFSKKLGTGATAVNSFTLGGQSGSYYLNYNNLTGTPTGFIPSFHYHEISDISGLQSELSGKLDSSYTGFFYPNSNPSGYITGVDTSIYATVEQLETASGELYGQISGIQENYLPLSGGTMTGALNVSDINVSIDSGYSFEPLVNNPYNRFFDSNGVAYIANYASNGFQVTIDGVGWELLINNPNSRFFDAYGYANYAHYAGGATYASKLVNNGEVTLDGSNWEPLISNPNGRFFDANGFANYTNRGTWGFEVTSDDGASWHRLTSNTNGKFFDVNGFANHANYAGSGTVDFKVTLDGSSYDYLIGGGLEAFFDVYGYAKYANRASFQFEVSLDSGTSWEPLIGNQNSKFFDEYGNGYYSAYAGYASEGVNGFNVTLDGVVWEPLINNPSGRLFDESGNALGLVLQSPNGTRYRLTVEDDGSLTTTSI